MMRAAAVEDFGPPESLRLTQRPVPEPREEEISIDRATL